MTARIGPFVFLLTATLMAAPQGGYAQKIKGISATRAALSSSVERSLVTAVKRPDIRLSVARLDHSVLMNYPPQQRPHSTAFCLKLSIRAVRKCGRLQPDM